MKKILTYLIVSASIFFLVSCDKPAPTQLVNDTNNDYEVELLNKDLENQYYTSGSDTSGITQDLTGITNLISVSGIKITDIVRTRNFSLAQAMFFDKSKPIKFSDGKLLSFQTIIPGIIKFNGVEANVVPNRLRFREEGIQKDTLIGNKYLLYNIFGGLPDPFYFDYNASVSFEFDPLGGGNNFTYPILTPQEITGTVIFTGKRINRNLQAELNWNPAGAGKISIIIGLIRANQISSVPVYRFKTADDGEIRIPGRLINQLPLAGFDKIVFTFIRSYEDYHDLGNNNLLVSSQSIHSIVIEIP
jgi:hypothetical protein